MKMTPKIILLQDVYEMRQRKEEELAFYHEQLEKLKTKMFHIRQEIDLTNVIIRIIEKEEVVDLRDMIDSKRNV